MTPLHFVIVFVAQKFWHPLASDNIVSGKPASDESILREKRKTRKRCSRVNQEKPSAGVRLCLRVATPGLPANKMEG